MKKILIIALALMLALSLVACNKNKDNQDGAGSNSGIILDPTGTGEGVGTGDPSTGGNSGSNNGNGNSNVVEEFTDLEQTIFVVADVASVRSEARIADETLIDYTAKDTEFKSTGYSANWYRIEYEVAIVEEDTTAAEEAAPAAEEVTETETEAETETTTDTETDTEAETEGETAPTTEIVVAYIHKSVACVKDLTAADLEEPLTLYIVAYALYVRSYYDFTIEDNKMCILSQGDEVVAIAQGNGWYKIQLADDAEGNPVFGYISSNEKYVSTTKPEATTQAE